jgi:hypothetical protein
VCVPVACRGLISGIIVLLNFVLKAILQWLVVFEKHWTQSDKVGRQADSVACNLASSAPPSVALSGCSLTILMLCTMLFLTSALSSTCCKPC